MKLGDVLKKEREGKTGLNRAHAFSSQEMAGKLGISVAEYEQLESGRSAVEEWLPLLCKIAVELKTPASRLLARSGKGADCKPGQAGRLVREQREAAGKTMEEMASLLGLQLEEYVVIEKGDSPLEKVGPLLLRFAELIEQPVFNLYLPCGVRFDELEDYP